MTTLLQLLSIGARSMGATQLAQSTVGNNAANAATPGYSRRRPQLSEIKPVQTPEGPMGIGVQVSGLDRIRDALLDTQWRLDSMNFQYSKAQGGILEQLGSLLSPADGTPLTISLNALFASFGDLATRPEDPATRNALVVQGQAFVTALASTYEQVQGLEGNVYTTINDRVDEVNQLATRLATLNRDLGQNRNDPSLLDERDRLVDRLSELIGVRGTQDANGMSHVIVNGTGIQLVDGTRAATLQVSGAATVGTVTLTIDGTTLTNPSGEIGGLLRVRNSSVDGIPYVLDQLDDLASGLIAAVNRIHAAGNGLTLPQSVTGSVQVADPTDMLDAAGLWLTPQAGNLTLGVFDAAGTLVSFSTIPVDPATMSLNDLAAAIDAEPNLDASVSPTGQLVVATANPANRLAFGPDTSDAFVALGVRGFFTGTDARTIAVSSDLVADPRLIAAAQADFAAGLISPGDGRNAAALAAVGDSTVLAVGTLTPADFIGNFGAAVGTSTRAAVTRADTLEAVLQSTDNARQSVAGVNLDEELADMVRYQHAYEASAKYVQTIDRMLQALLNMV